MPEPRHFQTYLGDAVYAYLDDFGLVWLYTSDGIRETNRIGLEPEVMRALLRWKDEVDEYIEVVQKKKREADAEEAADA